MLKNIAIEGFKSINKLNVNFEKINVLIGANGAGKSNFVRFFEFVRQEIINNKIVELRPEDVDKYLFCGKKITNSINLELNYDNNDCKNTYSVNLQLNSDNRFIFKSEIAKFQLNQIQKTIDLTNTLKSTIKNNKEAISYYIRTYIDNCKVYHFNDTGKLSPFRKTSLVANNTFLEKEGENLSSVLYKIKNENIDLYNYIVRRIKIVLPFFDDFILIPYMLDSSEYITLKWKQNNIDSVFDTSILSDGSIRFIALTVLINAVGFFKNDVILIDEPELGLHHQAIVALASMIKEMAEMYNTQFIISTQSVEFIDNFDLKNILIVDKKGNETVVTSAISYKNNNCKEYKEWLDNFSNSELWEKNLMGGNISG